MVELVVIPRPRAGAARLARAQPRPIGPAPPAPRPAGRRRRPPRPPGRATSGGPGPSKAEPAPAPAPRRRPRPPSALFFLYSSISSSCGLVLTNSISPTDRLRLGVRPCGNMFRSLFLCPVFIRYIQPDGFSLWISLATSWLTLETPLLKKATLTLARFSSDRFMSLHVPESWLVCSTMDSLSAARTLSASSMSMARVDSPLLYAARKFIS